MTSAQDDNRRLRPATPADLDRVCGIAVAAWERVHDSFRKLLGAEMHAALWSNWQAAKAGQIRRHFEAHSDWLWVCELDSRVVGFITFTLDPARSLGTIGNNAVAPEMQGRGLATWMYRQVLDEFRRRGLRHATVHTGLDEGHAPARRAYEKAGFNRQIPFVDYYMKL